MPGYVRWSRVAFNVLAWLFAASVGFQVYLAGLAVFAGEGFASHRDFGYAIALLPLVMLVLALLARAGRAVIGAILLIFVLFILQSVFVVLWKSNPPMPAAAAIHPLNGFVIGLVAVWIAWRTRGYLSTLAARSETPGSEAANRTTS